MAVPDHMYPSGEDFSAYQYKDDYSDVFKIAVAPRNRLMVLDKIPEREPVRSNPYYITDDVIEVSTVTLGEALDNSETLIDLASGDAKYLQNGDMLRATESGKTEWMQVNSTPDTTNDQVTVTRGIGGTTAETHTTAMDLFIVRSVEAGSERDMFEFVDTTRRENYTGTIAHTIGLTGSDMEDEPRSYQMSELDRQEAKVLRKLKGEMEDLALFGPGQARASGAHGQMKGIRMMINEEAGNNVDAGSSNPRWGYDLVNGQINAVVQEGAVDDDSDLICVVPSTGYDLAGRWGEAQVFKDQSERVFGFETQVIHSTLGANVPLVWTPRAMADEFMILSMDNISRHPKGSRSLLRYVKPQGRDLNDYEARRLIAEWGLKLYYPTKAHFIQKNVRFE